MADSGFKPARLASESAVSKGYLSELLKGNKAAPSFEVVKKFADVLDSSPQWLLYGRHSKHGTSIQITQAAPLPARDLTVDERLARMEAVMERVANALEKLVEMEEVKNSYDE